MVLTRSGAGVAIDQSRATLLSEIRMLYKRRVDAPWQYGIKNESWIMKFLLLIHNANPKLTTAIQLFRAIIEAVQRIRRRVEGKKIVEIVEGMIEKTQAAVRVYGMDTDLATYFIDQIKLATK